MESQHVWQVFQSLHQSVLSGVGIWNPGARVSPAAYRSLCVGIGKILCRASMCIVRCVMYIVRYLPSNFFMELMKPTVARMEICAGLYRPCCQNTEHSIGTYYYIHCIYYLSVGLTMNWHTSLECWANNNILDRCSDGCHLLLLLRPRCNWTPWPTTTRVNRGCPANNLANRITQVFQSKMRGQRTVAGCF